MTNAEALAQARSLQLCGHARSESSRNYCLAKIAAALLRAYADGIASHAGASLTARGEIADRAIEEADALERGEPPSPEAGSPGDRR